MIVNLVIIIVAQCIAIAALIYQNEIDQEKSYQKGFKKGLYYNVIRMSNGNEHLEVTDKFGKTYK